MSPNGEVIGVFAVFSPIPRMIFTARQRRELTDYGEIALQDLTSLREATDESAHITPILQRDSTVKGASELSNTSSTTPTINGKAMFELNPAVPKYHKPSRHHKPKSRVIINHQDRDTIAPSDEHTPPASDDSDGGPSPTLIQCKGFDNTPKQFPRSEMSNLSQHTSMTPDLPTFGDSDPYFRHSMGSEPSTVNKIQDLYTPVSSYVDEALVSPTIGKISTNEILSDGTVLSTPHPNTPLDHLGHLSSHNISPICTGAMFNDVVLFDEHSDTPATKDADATRSYVSKNGEYVDNDFIGQIWKDPEARTTSNSFLTDSMSSDASGLLDPRAEARFAAEFWAKYLGFDAIYAVELIPKRLFMTEEELTAPAGVETRMLASYGLQEPVNFDVPMHLNVLRTSGALLWENNNCTAEEYSRGFMMPLQFDFGMLELRSSGVVFGAFRKTPQDGDALPMLSSAEIERLRQAARVLKDILYKSSSERRPSQCRMEPPPSPTPAYPANEAVELCRFVAKRRYGRRQPEQR